MQTLDLEELEKAGGDFAPRMVESLKERIGKVEATVKVIAEGIDTMPEDGDFEGLRHAMDCLYQVKTQSDAIDYELDNLVDLCGYLVAKSDQGNAVAASANKLTALQESFGGAKKKAPALKKALRPLIEGQGNRISGEIGEFEQTTAEYVKAFNAEEVFNYACGAEPAYARMDEMNVALMEVEAQAAEFLELATLFDFPDQVNKSKEMVGTMRNDLCLTKRLWDITSVVQTTLEEWRRPSGTTSTSARWRRRRASPRPSRASTSGCAPSTRTWASTASSRTSS